MWWWKLEEEGIFSVKSCYCFLESLVLRDDVSSGDEERVFGYL